MWKPLALTALLVWFTPTDAAVLCARTKQDGSFDAKVTIREACEDRTDKGPFSPGSLLLLPLPSVTRFERAHIDAQVHFTATLENVAGLRLLNLALDGNFIQANRLGRGKCGRRQKNNCESCPDYFLPDPHVAYFNKAMEAEPHLSGSRDGRKGQE